MGHLRQEDAFSGASFLTTVNSDSLSSPVSVRSNTRKHSYSISRSAGNLCFAHLMQNNSQCANNVEIQSSGHSQQHHPHLVALCPHMEVDVLVIPLVMRLKMSVICLSFIVTCFPMRFEVLSVAFLISNYNTEEIRHRRIYTSNFHTRIQKIRLLCFYR